MKKIVIMMMAVLAGAMLAQAAPELRLLPWQTALKFGASHVIEVTHTDLAAWSATNTTAIFTNTVKGPCAVEFRGMVLDTPFDSATVTNALSMVINAGYSADSDMWIANKQVAADGTEVRYSFGSAYSQTNAALYEQTSDVLLLTSFGPCLANRGHDILSSGRVRLFYRILP